MSIKAKTSSTKRKTSPSILDNANKNTEGDGEDQATTIKRLKMENNSLKEKLKGYSDAEENAVKHKHGRWQQSSYQCCKHIDSSCSTRLQPNDSNMDDPSQYNAYSDKCDAKQVERVHYSQGNEHHLEWQCNCYQPCCKYLKDDLTFTMLCEECEQEKLHPKPASAGQAVETVTESTPSWVSLKEVRRLTALENHDVEEVFEEFAVAADDEGLIDAKAFTDCFHSIIARNGGQSDADSERTSHILTRLFNVFDVDGSGAVDFTEMASGLSVLCGGSRDQKAEAAFALYDYNGDGFISMEEMTRYLTSVFKVMYETQPGTAERMGVSAEELAKVTGEQAFADADLNHDGKLLYLSDNDEFQQWLPDSGQAVEEVIDATPSWVCLKEVLRWMSECYGCDRKQSVCGDLIK